MESTSNHTLAPHMLLIFYICYMLAKKTGITQCLQMKYNTWRICAQILIQTSKAEADVEAESDTGSLPDLLVNPEDYEPLLPTTKEHTAAEPGTVTHSRISSLLISRRLTRPRVASRYSVRPEGSATARLGVRDFEIHWISRGFRISEWISGFHSGFLYFSLDFCRQVSSCMFLDIF